MRIKNKVCIHGLMLLMAFAVIAPSAFAQQQAPASPQVASSPKPTISVAPNQNATSRGGPFWQEGFANGFSSTNGTWTVGGTDGNIWKHDFYGTSGEWSTSSVDPAFSSVANGFMLFDADSFNLPLSPNYVNPVGYLTSPTINLIGEPSVMLEFESYARGCCSSDPQNYVVEVSNNGGASWTQFPVMTSLPVNAVTANPEYVQVNITSAAANESTVNIRFHFNQNQTLSHYFWAIDDIELRPMPVNNLIANSVDFIDSWSTNDQAYHQYPDEHVVPMNFEMHFENFGAAIQTGVNLNVNVNNGSTVYNANASLASIASNDVDSLTTLPTYVPTAIGVYTANFTLTQNEVEETPADNLGVINFELTDTVWAKDDGNITGGYSWAGVGFDIGCYFGPAQVLDTVTSVSFYVDPATDAGALVYVSLWDWNAQTLLAQSADYTIQQSDTSTWITLPTFYELGVGEYVLATVGYYGTALNFVVGEAQLLYGVECYIYEQAANTWYYVTDAPMVRMNLGNVPLQLTTSVDQAVTCPSACDGTVSATALGGTGSLSYQWYNSSGPIGGATSPTLTNACGDTYWVIVSDNIGSITDTVVLTEPLMPNFTSLDYYPNPSGSVVCGDTASLSVWSGYINGNWIPASQMSITWSGGTLFPNNNAANVYGFPVTNTTYTLDVSYTDSCGNTATTQATIDIVVTTNFGLTVQASPTSGASPLVVIFDNQTLPLGNYDFEWIFGDGTSTVDNNSFVSHTYLVDGLWDVVLIATDISTGCSDTLFLDDYIFTTGGTPCTHFATIDQTGPITACAGDSVLLSCNTDPNFQYQWNLSGIGINGANDSVFYPTQSGTYSVTIIDANCPVVSANISVVINPSPATPTITALGQITFCAGGSVDLEATAGFASYLWSTGGTSQIETVTTSGNYSVTVSDNNGCTASSAVFSVNASGLTPPDICLVGVDTATNNNMIVWEKPFSAGIDSFRVYKEGSSANVYEYAGSVDYNVDGVFIDANSNPAVQANRYKLAIVDTCGTVTLQSPEHKTIHLTINQGSGLTWNLIWSHYEGFSFPSYNIFRGSDPQNMTLLTTIASNLDSYTDLTPPLGTVVYQIEVVSPNVCDPTRATYENSRSNIVNEFTEGLMGYNALEGATLYPNPNNGEFSVSGILPGTTLELTNAIGQVVWTSSSTAVQHNVKAKGLESGVYFLILNHERGAQTLRLVIQ
jgi:hypothetical protein